MGGVVLHAGLYSPVRSSRAARALATADAEGEGEGEGGGGEGEGGGGEAAMPELLSLVRLLGLGDATLL